MLNNNIEIRIRKIDPRASLPSYETAGAAGADLAACLRDGETIIIKPNQWAKVGTGLALEIPPTMVGLVFGRSGLAYRQGVTLQNAVGVIDSDYRGELAILVRNEGAKAIEISHGDRIGQLVIMPFYQAKFISQDALKETERSTGGFGSTGL